MFTHQNSDENKTKTEIIKELRILHSRIAEVEKIKTNLKTIEEKVSYLYFYDSLTGLYNQAFFEEEIERLNSLRKYPLSIVVITLNNLELINNTFGYEQGDKALKYLTKILKSVSRKEDILARIWENKFAIVLPNTTEEIIRSVCKRIKNACKKSTQKFTRLKLNISLGYATQFGLHKNMRAVLKEADDSTHKEELKTRKTNREQIINFFKLVLAERDPHTEEHSNSLQNLAVSLGQEIGLSESKLKDLRLLALLHDIGKIGIPDSILYKPGKLSPEEWEKMKEHSEIGYRIAREYDRGLPAIAEEILSHHEWWNGKGYPRGLKGEKIPLLARIISIVDAYNVMLSDRPYKKAMSKQEAIEEVKRCAGTQFDPYLAKRFLKIVRNR